MSELAPFLGAGQVDLETKLHSFIEAGDYQQAEALVAKEDPRSFTRLAYLAAFQGHWDRAEKWLSKLKKSMEERPRRSPSGSGEVCCC